MATYRVNRAVGVFNKGDVFESDPDHPMLESLIGAGYADLIYEPGTPDQKRNDLIIREAGGDDEPTLRTEPGDDQD